MRENAHSWTFFLISLLHPNVPKNCCKFHENTIITYVISTSECVSTMIVNDCNLIVNSIPKENDPKIGPTLRGHPVLIFGAIWMIFGILTIPSSSFPMVSQPGV